MRASSAASGLVAVVAELTGSPLVDRKAPGAVLRSSRLGLWESWEDALERAGFQAAAWVAEWNDGVRRTGLLIRAGDAAPSVIQQTMAVLRTLATTLPLAAQDGEAVRQAISVAPSFELAELASWSCADAHALVIANRKAEAEQRPAARR